MKLTDTYFSRYFFYKLARHKVLLLVSLVANILALPLMSAITSSSVETIYDLMSDPTRGNRFPVEVDQTAENVGIALFLCICVFAVLVIISLATPTLVMSYNNKRSDSDMYLSLPISTKSRFLADSLAGFVVAVLPLMINLLGGFIFIQKAANLIAENRELFIKINQTINTISGLWVCNAYDTFCFAATTGIITVTAVYFVSLFFTCTTGRKAESVIWSIAAPLIVLLTLNNLTTLILNTTPGVMSWPELESLTAHLPAFGTLFAGMGKFSAALSTSGDMVTQTLAFPITVIISAVVICLLLLFAAYLCTAKRKAESTGKPFAIEFVYKVIMTLLVICFVSFLMVNFRGNQSGLAVTVLVLFAIYMTLQLFHYKSIKKIPKHLLHLVLTSAIAFGGFTLIVISEGLGYGRYIPDSAQVESVTVSEAYTGIYKSDGLIYTDKKDIEMVSQLHKECIDSKTETGYLFRITYKLKNGTIVSRSYIETLNVHQKLCEEIKSTLLSAPATIEQVFEGGEISTAEGSFILKEDFTVSGLSQEGTIRLMEAIKQDGISGALTSGKITGCIELFWWSEEKYNNFYISVTENCKNIISGLENKENHNYSRYNHFYDSAEKAAEPDSICMYIEDITDEDFSMISNFHIRNKDMENDKVKALIELMEFDDKDFTPPYHVMINASSISMYITEENADKAERLMEEIKAEREKSGDNIDFTDFFSNKNN